MIKIIAVNRDGNNSDNTIFTVEYDINGVIQNHVFMDYQMEAIMTDTLQMIKQKVLDFVAVQRGDVLWSQVLSKVTPYIGVDLEA